MLSKTLKELLNERNMSLQELADQANIPYETMRNIYYGKVTDPKVSTMMSIANVFQLSVNYLMGKSLYSPEEQALIRNYRKCGVHGKSIIMLVSKYEANTARSERESKDKHKIPCLAPIKVKDGFIYDSNEVLEIETTNKEAYTSIQITSHAYGPVFCKGDKILIADRFPENGERGVFVKEGRGYIRQFIEKDDCYILKSVNGREAALEFKRLDEIDCIGTCVGVVMA
ncbi:MAG: helix-turn-helix domain-containing protein [Lachnospiraceae bacterium]|nr:helix-turn-helix domain-containing protein [Lachnospiraceae bacterium]